MIIKISEPASSKEVLIDGKHRIILSNIGEKIYAVSGLCSHYRAPLITGAHSVSLEKAIWYLG